MVDYSLFYSADGIEKKYKIAQMLMFDIREQLNQLERETGSASIFLHGQISGNINELTKWLEELEEFCVSKSSTIPNKQVMNIKITQLSGECKSLRQQIGIVLHRHTLRTKEEEARSQLLERKSSSSSSRFQTAIELMEKENQHASFSLSRALDIEEQGQSILQKLSIQNQMFEIAESLGFSRTLLKSIQRREWTDKIIVFGGMIFVLLLIFFLYFFVRS